VTSRTYLSIGDVLTLLREEFPDVTISKIRFLESQGLVNPERSPSGYRKFFEHDVERLRWVLRQQREHFLPLKVIRDRLADGDLDDHDGAERPNGKSVQPAHVSAVAGATSDYDHEQPTKADEEAMARILADATRRAAARVPEETQPRRGLQVVAEDEGSPRAATGLAAPREVASAEPARRASGERRSDAVAPASGRTGAAPQASPGPAGRVNGTALPHETGTMSPRGDPAAGEAGPRKGPGKTSQTGKGAVAGPPTTGAAGPPATGAAGPPTTEAAIVTGASLSADELCGASGLSLEEVAGLKSFGLLESVTVAGIETYDENALTMANLAAAFGSFGIEARHLRLYKNAADRELGLIEQVVIPLLRQRNPESRQRAVERADQLAALGQSMRATLLRQALRRHLGG
jgi:DNA-binding transcriptional MerR regulator